MTVVDRTFNLSSYGFYSGPRKRLLQSFAIWAEGVRWCRLEGPSQLGQKVSSLHLVRNRVKDCHCQAARSTKWLLHTEIDLGLSVSKIDDLFASLARFLGEIGYIVPPFVVGYLIYSWAKKNHAYRHTKAGMIEYGEVSAEYFSNWTDLTVCHGSPSNKNNFCPYFCCLRCNWSRRTTTMNAERASKRLTIFNSHVVHWVSTSLICVIMPYVSIHSGMTRENVWGGYALRGTIIWITTSSKLYDYRLCQVFIVHCLLIA